jgi:hypothetical protein
MFFMPANFTALIARPEGCRESLDQRHIGRIGSKLASGFHVGDCLLSVLRYPVPQDRRSGSRAGGEQTDLLLFLIDAHGGVHNRHKMQSHSDRSFRSFGLSVKEKKGRRSCTSGDVITQVTHRLR